MIEKNEKLNSDHHLAYFSSRNIFFRSDHSFGLHLIEMVFVGHFYISENQPKTIRKSGCIFFLTMNYLEIVYFYN